MEKQFGEEIYKKLFNIQLGVRDPDQCTDEELVAGAVPKIWIKELEREFTEALYWQKFIGTGKDVGVVRKDELIRQPGDTIYINKLGQLTNVGDLGTTHTLEGNEEQMALSRVAFNAVDRIGNAICWPIIVGHRVTFDMRGEARDLLSDWAATKVDTMHFNAAYLSAAANVLYGGTANSRNTITATDTISAHDLKRVAALLMNNKARRVAGAEGDFIGLIHPFQGFDLKNDADWVAANRYAGSERIFDGEVGRYMGIRILETGQVQSIANAASPSETVYRAVFFGARALGLAWGQPWTWREKISSYGEQAGIGTDAWLQAKILNQDYLYILETAATNPATA